MGVLNVDDPTYRALNCWSWSTAKHVLECPAEAHDQRFRPIDCTDAMEMGTLMHALILEPETLDDRFGVAPSIVKGNGGWTWEGADSVWRLKKEADAALAGVMGDRFLVTKQLMDDLQQRCHQPRVHALANATETELAMVGQIEGCAVKGKADMLTKGAIIDVKTTSDIKPAAIERAAYQRRWFGQVWTYGELARQAGFDVTQYGIIVVQAPRVSGSPLKLSSSRQPRPSWRLVWLSDAAVEYGENEARSVWRAIRDCEASKTWPDYDESEINPPRWARSAPVQDEAF